MQWLKQDSCSFVYLGVSSFFLKSHTWAHLGLWGPWRKKGMACYRERKGDETKEWTEMGGGWSISEESFFQCSLQVPNCGHTAGLYNQAEFGWWHVEAIFPRAWPCSSSAPLAPQSLLGAFSYTQWTFRTAGDALLWELPLHQTQGFYQLEFLSKQLPD